jgi:hypothetical protein
MTKKPTSKKIKVGEYRDACFVLMPFGGWRDDYYETIYKPAIESSGLDPHRADDLFRPSTIVNDIWAYTKRAKLLLADLSGKNPNVFYELGLAHALAKPAILIAESMEEIPFDLRALRIIVYDKNAPDWGKLLRDKIGSAISEVLKSPVEAVLPAFLDVKGESSKTTVSQQEKDLIEIKQELDLLRREIRSRENIDLLRNELIGADEARARIREYLRIGMPENIIIDRLVRSGPPNEWIIKEIKKIKQSTINTKEDNIKRKVNTT